MLKITPSYSDDFLKRNVRYQRGPAISDPTGLAARHRVSQAQGELAVESAGSRLGLEQQRLEQSKSQFNDIIGQRRGELDLGKQYGETANRIALAGLGVSMYGKYKESQRLLERQEARDAFINKLKKAGDAESLFWADLMGGI